MFRLGVIVNPYAGLGGTVGLKGSDGEATVAEALARGAEPRALERMARALSKLKGRKDLHIYCYNGAMGEQCLAGLDVDYTVIGQPSATKTTAADTNNAAKSLHKTGADLSRSPAGAGTARTLEE